MCPFKDVGFKFDFNLRLPPYDEGTTKLAIAMEYMAGRRCKLDP